MTVFEDIKKGLEQAIKYEGEVLTMNNEIREALEKWVRDNYVQHTTGWTYERSSGNDFDCFDDGYQCATSWAAYEVGCILGMELEEPECAEEEC